MKVQSKRKQTRQRRINITAGVFAGVVLLGVVLPRLFSVTVAFVMQPVHTVNTWLEESQSVFPVFVRDRQSLAEEIEGLENELANQAGLDASRQYLKEENVRLRSLVGAEIPKRIAASVIARPNELPYDVLQIDKGATAGIEVGAPVFINEYVVIGVITHVAQTYSFAELVSSVDFRSTVFIGGPNVIAELVGLGGGTARVRVPQGVPIAVGNTVALPSVNTSVLGRLEHIESEPTQPEQYGYFTLPIGLQRLHTVAVGQSSEVITDASEIDASIRESIRQGFLVPNMSSSTFAITPEISTTTVDTTTDTQ